METTITKNKNQKKALLTIAIIALGLFLCSIAFHISPYNILSFAEDFAIHHYYLTGFASLVIFLFCAKYYFSHTEKGRAFKLSKSAARLKRAEKRKERLKMFTKRFSIKIQTLKSHFIDKNQINGLEFSKSDVLDSLEDTARREEDLYRAMKLGNSLKHKVKLFFKDLDSNKHIETTIWHANDKHVTLKGGIVIPVRSIYKIEI